MRYREQAGMKRYWLLCISCLCLLLAGCTGGDSANGNSVLPETPSGGVACATPSANGASDEASSQLQVPGAGWYQNGFVATRLQVENVTTGETRTVLISTNQDIRQISNPDPLGNRLPGLFFDAGGRVTAIDSLTGTSVPVAVSYNEAGAISRLRDDRGDSSEEVRFTYEGGQLTQRSRVSNFNGQPEPEISAICYRYDASGQLLEAVPQDPVTGVALPTPLDRFRLDDSGNITEVTKAVDRNGGFTARHVLTYDSNGNIIKHETYTSDGALQRVESMTYEPSSDPTPNLFGLLSFINPDFIPRYESTLP